MSTSRKVLLLLGRDFHQITMLLFRGMPAVAAAALLLLVAAVPPAGTATGNRAPAPEPGRFAGAPVHNVRTKRFLPLCTVSPLQCLAQLSRVLAFRYRFDVLAMWDRATGRDDEMRALELEVARMELGAARAELRASAEMARLREERAGKEARLAELLAEEVRAKLQRLKGKRRRRKET